MRAPSQREGGEFQELLSCSPRAATTVTWSEEKLVIQPRRFVHTYDPCLWIDPQRRLWFFWAQSAGVQDGRMGVWAMVTTDADSETPSGRSRDGSPTESC